MNESLQEFLDHLRATAAEAGSVAADVLYSAGKQAGKVMDGAKRGLKVADLKAEVNVTMRELGELLYATHTGNPTDSEVLLAKMQEIDALKAQIAALQGEKFVACPFCGTHSHDGDAFCRECGNPLN